jgi:small-conductance mechanosensitive channel
MLAQSWLARHDHEITAIVAILGALVVVRLLNRAIDRRGRVLAEAFGGGQVSDEARTRLRFLRRLLDAGIILVGVAIATSQFATLDRLAQTILTSSAIAAAIIGFAARQVLANALAGMLIAVTQPLRIGDRVTFEGETGTVEDIRLTSTWLRSPTRSRIIIPNERLAGGILLNDSIEDPDVAMEPSVWVAAEADAVDALDRMRAEFAEDVTVRVAESTAEGTRFVLLGPAGLPGERPRREAELRERALRAIHAAR